MCVGTSQRYPITCIISPEILQNIARRGSAGERDVAINTLAIGETIRAFRAAQLPPSPLGSRRPAMLAQPVKQRSIYDAGGRTELPGRLIRGEGAPATGDVAVDEAYDGLGAVWDFFHTVFDRNSIDNEGMPIIGVVHFGKQFDNAFWDTRHMVFGDGDLFGRFTVALDVIGHELTHGITHDESGLNYFQQPGALNESLSDVFGVLVKQWVLKQTAAEANWLIGETLFEGTQLQGIALRSLKAPGTAYDDPLIGRDPQPRHMRNFVKTLNDNGGVHINSGIPNHAFYLIATALGGHAWEKAGRIWYETLRDPKVRRSTGFTTFARQTVYNAGVLYGIGGEEQQAVTAGWREVGVLKK